MHSVLVLFFSFHQCPLLSRGWGVKTWLTLHVAYEQTCFRIAGFSYSCLAVGARWCRCRTLSVALTETTEVMSDIKRAVKVSSNGSLTHCYEMTCLDFTGLKLCSLPQACAPLQTCKKKERKKKMTVCGYHSAIQSQTYSRVMTVQVMCPRYLKNESSRVINSICQVLNQDYIRREWVDYSFHTSQMPTTC